MATLDATFNAADQSDPGHYGPSQTALLLLDFHSMFVNRLGGPAALAATKVAAKLRTWARSQGIQVIHGLIDINDAPCPTCKDAERLKGFMAAIKPSSAAEPAELLEGEGDVTFTRKPGQVSALKSTQPPRLLAGQRNKILSPYGHQYLWLCFENCGVCH